MRALLTLLGLLAITWLEFQFYPGHSYLQGETRFYVPMLERLDTPGFLSRDLVASNPAFAYTVYDEVTLFLHQALHLSFERALASQQLLFRFAAIVGIYLLIRSMGAGRVAALMVTACTNAITLLAAPQLFVTNPEPVPAAFAFALVLLAVGLLAQEKPLLGGFASGVALLYDPVIAAAFWLVICLAMIADKRIRRLLRPTLPVLLVFVLLLANLVQLQAGLGGAQDLGNRFSPAITPLSRLRTPNLWPSLWASHQIWNYLFLFIAMLWAVSRVWPRLNRITRWLVLGLAAFGLAGVAISAALLNGMHLEIAAQLSPQRFLSFTVALAAALAGVAAWLAFKHSHRKETIAWALLVAAIIANPQLLNLPRFPASERDGAAASLPDLAAWAESSTWGSSMFLFADAGRAAYPATFRALSRRSLWSDWQSGAIVNYSDQAGLEWWARWSQTMRSPYSAVRLQSFLSLPIDYFVLKRRNRLNGIKPAFETNDYVVYDALDLRKAALPFTPVQEAR